MKFDELSENFLKKFPDRCAAVTTSAGQKLFYLLLAAAGIALLAYRWDVFVLTVSGAVSILYLSSAVFRITAACLGMSGVRRDDKVPECELPVYTIMLPVYREEAVAAKLIDRIGKLDYPKDKLDVKVLLEADDPGTLEALKKADPPDCFEFIVMPPLQPKTKPRSCNYALAAARGEFCVIYDAEDAPEPDQLKKAVAAFRADRSGKLVCVQAKLNYYNPKQNLLTRLFTIEYTTHFDLVMPGMSRFQLPLPLGGTSNHFRVDALRKIGGWDPFNVTEDCDLGIRIYENGFRTGLLDSTTWEEANSRIGNFLRQRSRWVKGFIQTHLVHYRNIFRTVRRLGFRGAFGGYLAIGGGSWMLLLNLVFWIMLAGYALLVADGCRHGLGVWEQISAPNFSPRLYDGIALGSFRLRAWPLVYFGSGEDPVLSALSQVFFASSAALFLANFIFIFIGMLGCLKRKYYFLLPCTLLLPFYWIMLSIGGWKGFIQLFHKPFFWEKTRHGLDGKKGKDDSFQPLPEMKKHAEPEK